MKRRRPDSWTWTIAPTEGGTLPGELPRVPGTYIRDNLELEQWLGGELQPDPDEFKAFQRRLGAIPLEPGE